ncbi:MAG TPA: phosphoribosylglycinamide formyltransferase [Spirochaetota bacterium]|jgi:phosphoribosylglycinamide formyltransferase-1|nr:MAG: Phosphoribosylglycinamide formyltransferase [Spirochaetes bacterium ADurb.Bin133]HNZ27585.1 phosphoribosylglycinamide formyltransferase [Spirochaetota bacterium]HPY88553.1 phosphoribosylglycinamide formyltransferase [Spirochaetota bacterium]HQB61034.1 phosphoribosylglycinamide formyltransferase [Spirochaetota bacterium]
MARIAVFASGNGSNFEALAAKFKDDKIHNIVLLICDRKNAYVLERAKNHGVKFEIINYVKNSKKEVEDRILRILKENEVDIIFLAGFMRILSAEFIEKASIPIINIHPSLLPKYKGTEALRRAYESTDDITGISIHYVNKEVDGGELILQKEIIIDRDKGLDFLEKEIHKLEHKWYTKVAKDLCDKLEES